METSDGRLYGSFRGMPFTEKNKRRIPIKRITLTVMALLGLILGTCIHVWFSGKASMYPASSTVAVNDNAVLLSRLQTEEKSTGNIATNHADVAPIVAAVSSSKAVPSCAGLSFSDPMHHGKQVCTVQQCTGVVYFRYVDTSTFACTNDPSLVAHPCDVSKCPGVGSPPPPPPPPPPSGSSQSGDSSSQPQFPKVPDSLRKPTQHTSVPLPKAVASNTTYTPPPPLSNLSPFEDIGYAAANRDKSSFSHAKKLWGFDGEPKSAWPTHVFWQNLVLGEGTDVQSAITVLPYVVQVVESGIVLAYPYTMSSASQTANMFDLDAQGITLSSSSLDKRSISRFDPLSVSIEWKGGEGGSSSSSSATTTLVQGDPYVTLNLDIEGEEEEGFSISSEQTLILASRGDGSLGSKPVVCDPNKDKSKRQRTVTGSVFDIYASGTDETWRLYTFPSEVELECPYPKDVNHTATQIKLTNSEFKGVIRMAVVSNCTTGVAKHCHGPSGLPLPEDQVSTPSFAAALDAYSSVVLKGGNVDYDIDNETNTLSLRLIYESYSLNKESSSESVVPLLLALPHHIAAMSSQYSTEGNNNNIAGGHRSMLGMQVPIAATSIDLSLPLPSVLWGDERELNSDSSKLVRKALLDEADYDLTKQWRLGVGDPYNAGKLNARIARLAMIASQLDESEIADSFLDKLEKYQALWLSGESPNPLIYDQDMGGIVSCGCLFDSCQGKCTPHCNNAGPRGKGGGGCPNLGPGAFAAGLDFGNGYYNDHHFHYGYHLYAAAVLARFRPSWAKKHREQIMLLVRDVANPSNQDKYFPQFRHMDFYAGHSWAGGIFRSFANGRNQESTSEAVNCWYAITLLGDALEDEQLKTVGMTLLASEVHGAQTYWQLVRNQTGYDPIFETNGVTGILWSNLAQFQTWFGLYEWAVNGIQMLPFTPISEYLLRPDWIRQQIDSFGKACEKSPICTGDGWSPLVCMALSIADQEKGLTCAQHLPKKEFSDQTAEGNGNSWTNTLHFIESRPATL